MNVRILAKGAKAGTDPAPAGDPKPAAKEAAPDARRKAPVTVGDRVRSLVSSGGEKAPMYPRVLRLKNVHPNGWQRALLVEGMVLAGALVALADQATAWAPLVLPVGAAVVVKFHDVLAGLLPRPPRPRGGPGPADDSAASPTEGNAAGTTG